MKLDILLITLAIHSAASAPAQTHSPRQPGQHVESIAPGRKMGLFAEMKLPGRAWLGFEAQPDGDGTRLRQTATFDPLGLWGLMYWYAVWPLHQLIFAGMLRGLVCAAGNLDAK